MIQEIGEDRGAGLWLLLSGGYRVVWLDCLCHPAAGRLCADKAPVGDVGLWLLSSDRFLIQFCGVCGRVQKPSKWRLVSAWLQYGFGK